MAMKRPEYEWLKSKWFWYLLTAAFIAAALCGCSVQKKCDRIERKIVAGAKHCLNLNRTDTITVKDTFFVGTIRKDSTFVMNKTIDTFYLNKERLHVQIYKQHDTLMVHGQCDSIYVVKEIRVPYEQIYVKELNVWIWKITRFLKFWWWAIVLALALYLIYRFRRLLPV
jgi:hypothetical protein